MVKFKMNFLEMFGFKKKEVVEGNNPAAPVNQAPPPAGMPFGSETDPTPIQPVTEVAPTEPAEPVTASSTPTPIEQAA